MSEFFRAGMPEKNIQAKDFSSPTTTTTTTTEVGPVRTRIDQEGGRFPPFSGDFLKQLFTLSRVYDGIPFVIMRLPHSNSFKCARTIELYGTYSSTGIQRKLRHDFALQRSNDMIMLLVMYADICHSLARNYQPIRARIRRTPIVYVFDWAYHFELRLSDWIGGMNYGFIHILYLNMKAFFFIV